MVQQRKTSEITTIKLNKKTKERLEKLRVHHRETYEEIVQRILDILNICRANPERARRQLIHIEQRIRSDKNSSKNLT